MKKEKEIILFNLISHPIRIKIIELLAMNESMSFSELKKELGISTGSIYHHLSVLSNFIIQDEKKRYKLNEEGYRLYKFIKNSEYKLTSSKNESRIININNIFNGNMLFLLLMNNNKLIFALLPILVIFYPEIYSFSNILLRILFLKDVRIVQFSDSLFNFIINWILIYLILEIIFSLFFKNRRNKIYLFTFIPFVYTPLVIYSILFKFISMFTNEIVLRFLFALFQAWTIIILIKAIQVSKGESLQNILIAILVLYMVSIVSFLSF